MCNNCKIIVLHEHAHSCSVWQSASPCWLFLIKTTDRITTIADNINITMTHDTAVTATRIKSVFVFKCGEVPADNSHNDKNIFMH